MVNSLLSIFDPSSPVLNNWFGIIFVLFTPFWFFYWMSYPLMSLKNKIVMFKNKAFNVTNHTGVIFSSIFSLMLVLNMSGLFPYVHSYTSHPSFNMSISLNLWLSCIIWGFYYKFNKNVAHLTPQGCPTVLIPFMVLVELVSTVIRPITLSLRLTSNMLAGHLVLTLVGIGMTSSGFGMTILMYVCGCGFITFEIGVAIVQSYIFSYLMYLYWEES